MALVVVPVVPVRAVSVEGGRSRVTSWAGLFVRGFTRILADSFALLPLWSKTNFFCVGGEGASVVHVWLLSFSSCLVCLFIFLVLAF